MKGRLGISSNLAVGHVGNFSLAKNHTFLIDIFEKILIMQNGLKIRFGEIVRLEILPEAAYGKHDGKQDL